MASPQKENGYTGTAHELVEAICRLDVSGSCHRILRFVERKTYGYSKKEDCISLSQFETGTKMYRPRVQESLNTLVSLRVLFVDRSTMINKYRINKDYESWGSTQNRTSTEKRATSTENRTKTSTENRTHNSKYQLTKESPSSTETTNSQLPTKSKSTMEYTYEPIEGGSRKKKGGKEKNAEIIKIGLLFEKMGEKATGVKPDLTKAYFIIKNAKEKHDVDDFPALFAYFFADKKLSLEQKVSLSFVCSGAYITQWKVNRKHKVVNQVEASEEIML